MHLSANFEQREKITVVEVEGELDTLSGPSFRRQLQDNLAHAQARHFVIDLDRLAFIDSQGLGVLIWFFKEVSKAGGTVHVVAADNHMRRLLGVTGLDRVLGVFDTQAAAIGAAEPSR